MHDDVGGFLGQQFKLDDDIQEYLRYEWKCLKRLDNIQRARFAVALVRRRLRGSDYAEGPYDPWDIDWNGHRLDIVCSGAHQAWHEPDDEGTPARWTLRPGTGWDRETREDKTQWWADIYILARHEGRHPLEDWSFYILNDHQRLGIFGSNGGSRTASGLRRHGILRVSLDGLAAAVEHAASEMPRADR